MKKERRDKASRPTPILFAQSLPQAVEAEQGVLGSLLLDPASLSQITHLTVEHFGIENHRRLFGVLSEMAQARQVVDFLTVTHELQARGWLETIGGAAEVVALARNVPTALHIKTYADLVVRAFVQRQVIAVAEQLADLGFARGDFDAEALVTQAYEIVSHLGVPKEAHAVGFQQVVDEFLPLVENYLAGQRTTWGIPTQLTRLDEATGGLVAGELVVLAADPGMGKSALLAKILTNVARQGFPVWWCSFEMPRNDLVLRLLADWGDVPTRSIQHGTVNEAEKARLLEAAARLKALPLTLCDQPLSTTEIRGALLRQRHAPPQVIGIDYSLLLSDQNENETQRVANISRACKNLATEFQATVILVHSTDGQAAREMRPPKLNELSWGRRMQYDSDLVLSPWFNPQRRDHSALIAVLKKRNGESNGMIPMIFDAAHTRWADAPTSRREKP